MTKRSRPFLWFRSDNRKSAIQNPKWWGIFALTFTFALGGVVALAQQTGKVARIGFLDPSTASGSAVLLDAFRREMGKLGWIEGKNITIEYRFAEQKNERLAGRPCENRALRLRLFRDKQPSSKQLT